MSEPSAREAAVTELWSAIRNGTQRANCEAAVQAIVAAARDAEPKPEMQVAPEVDDSPNHLGERIAELRARGFERINDPRPTGQDREADWGYETRRWDCTDCGNHRDNDDCKLCEGRGSISFGDLAKAYIRATRGTGQDRAVEGGIEITNEMRQAAYRNAENQGLVWEPRFTVGIHKICDAILEAALSVAPQAQSVTRDEERHEGFVSRRLAVKGIDNERFYVFTLERENPSYVVPATLIIHAPSVTTAPAEGQISPTSKISHEANEDLQQEAPAPGERCAGISVRQVTMNLRCTLPAGHLPACKFELLLGAPEPASADHPGAEPGTSRVCKHCDHTKDDHLEDGGCDFLWCECPEFEPLYRPAAPPEVVAPDVLEGLDGWWMYLYGQTSAPGYLNHHFGDDPPADQRGRWWWRNPVREVLLEVSTEIRRLRSENARLANELEAEGDYIGAIGVIAGKRPGEHGVDESVTRLVKDNARLAQQVEATARAAFAGGQARMRYLHLLTRATTDLDTLDPAEDFTAWWAARARGEEP